VYVLGPKAGTCKTIDAQLIVTKAVCKEAGQKLNLGKFAAVVSKKRKKCALSNPSEYPIACPIL
jgi:hypothetical protein